MPRLTRSFSADSGGNNPNSLATTLPTMYNVIVNQVARVPPAAARAGPSATQAVVASALRDTSLEGSG